MKDLILIPTYNEKENIGQIVNEIFAAYFNVDILVIDDNSPDQTADEVKRLSSKYGNLRLLQRSAKNGLGAAYIDAIARVRNDSQYRSIITMDADGSHDPKFLADFIRLIADYDLVVGSRYIDGGDIEKWEPWRKALSSYGNLYAKFFTRLSINDLTAGFICVRREILQKIDFNVFDSSGYAYQIEFKYACVKAGARFKETPIVFKSRRGGESKISNQIIREGLITPIKIFITNLWKKDAQPAADIKR